MSEIICPYCGASNPVDALKCSTCKLSLYDDAEPASQTPQNVSFDWLDNLRDTESQPENVASEPEKEEPPKPAEPEIPDWLAKIRARKQEDTPAPEPQPPAELVPGRNEPDDSLPEWIRDLKQGESQPAAVDLPESIPDWLRTMASGDDLTAVEGPPVDKSLEATSPDSNISAHTSPPSDLPGTSDSLEGQAPAEIQPEEDWLAERFSTQIPEPSGSETPAKALDIPTGEAPDESSEISPLPGWMQDSFDIDLSREETPKEQDSSRLQNDIPTQDSNAPSGVNAEEGLPGWLFEEQSDADFPGSEYTTTPAADIEKGQIPGWLHAIRPVEAAAPEIRALPDEDRIEPTGPLAGYQGILPGEGLVTHYSKPPIYSGKLQVTDKQRIYATLFDTLIAEEQQPGTGEKVRSNSLQLVFRMVVGLLLIVVLTGSLILKPGFAPFPTLVPPETVSFFTGMQTLTSGTNPARILVGMDYNPALAGEMRTISVPVMASWMKGNTGLALVSINATGPALAEELVNAAAGSVPGYLKAERFINLGYLPGGASGLAGLAANPAQGSPATFDGLPAWNSLLLQGISQISEFDGILLLTDNAENARAWIEQVMPAAGDKPLFVVSSAQVAPVLQPYVQSGQIAGFISGFTGAAAFEQLTQSTAGPIRGYWDAFQWGMLFIAALMVIGFIFFGIKNSLKRIKKA